MGWLYIFIGLAIISVISKLMQKPKQKHITEVLNSALELEKQTLQKKSNIEQSEIIQVYAHVVSGLVAQGAG